MVYQHKIGKISKLRQRSVILLAVLTLVAQPLYGIFANQGANAVSQAPFSIDVTCQDSKAVFNLVTRQAELPGVPQDARNWYATVTYQAGEYGNRVQTLSEKDIDTWTISTGKYSTDTVGMSARIVGGYTMREDIIVFGQKVGSWDKPYIYTRTLHAESAAKICDTTKPSVSVLLSKVVISPADNNNPSVTINATDSESGIDSIEYKITPRNDASNNIIGWTSVSNGVATEVTGANALDDGHYTLRARAFDNVGNKSSGNDVDFMVDGTDATTQILAPVKDEPISGTYRFHGTAADDVSGVEKVLIRIGTLEGNDNVFTDWTDFDPNTGKWYLDVNTIENNIPDGIYNVRARAVDNAGNNGNSGMHVLRNFVVDNTAPTFRLTDDGDPRQPITNNAVINPARLGDRDNNNDSIRFSKESTQDTLYVNDQPIFNHGYFNRGTSGQIGAAFRNDGQYVLHTQDLAGNRSEEIAFTVDTKTPGNFAIKLSDGRSVNGLTLNGEREFIFTQDELNPQRIYIEYMQKDVGGVYRKLVGNEVLNANKARLEIDTELWGDGDYQIKVSTRDAAGNATSVTAEFLVHNTTSQNQDGDEQTDQPVDLIIDPSPGNLSDSTGGSEISSTSAPAFTAFGLTFNDSGFATGSPIPEGGEDILGAEDDGFGSTFGDGNVLGQTAAAQDVNNSPLKAFGVLWYWWLVAFAVFASAWWLIAAKRRKQNDDMRI